MDAKTTASINLVTHAERALEGLRRRGASGDVHLNRVSGLTAEVVKGKLRNCRADGRLHLSVRAVRDGRIGFYSTTDLTAPDAAAGRAVEVAETGEELAIEFPGAIVAPAESAPLTFDREAAGLDAAGIARFVGDLAARVTELTPGAQVEAGGLREVQVSVLANTSGLLLQREATHIETVLQLSQFSASDVFVLYQGRGSARLKDPAFEGMTARMAGLHQASRSPAALAPGKRRVVFSPETLGVLLRPVFAGLDGINVNTGVSPLAGRLGDQVLDSRFSLTDDPWLDWSAPSALRDDEGVPTARRELFSNGTLQGYLHDLRSAALGKTVSTGNGRRGRGGPPRIAPFNVVIGTGQLTLAQLLEEAEGGLYVVSVIGGMPGVIAGAFSHPVGVGYLIKDGRLAGRVKDVAIAGNAYELCCEGLVGLEDEARLLGGRGFDGRLLAPHVLLDGVDVSGR